MSALSDVYANRDRASKLLSDLAMEIRDIQDEKQSGAKALWEREKDALKRRARATADQDAASKVIARLSSTIPRDVILAREEWGAEVRKLQAKINQCDLDARSSDLELQECRKRSLPASAYSNLTDTIVEQKKYRQEVQDELEEAQKNLKDREDLVTEHLEEAAEAERVAAGAVPVPAPAK